MKSGIYAIVFTDGKQYIGSAVNFVNRWTQHRKTLREGIHRNIKLQRAWNKYGEAAFEFRKLLICAPKNLLFYEQRCLDAFKPEYNLFPTAGSAFGWKHSLESLAKISAVHLGAKRPAETGAKISAAKTGKKLSAEHRAKLKLKKLSPEHKAALNATGRIVSPETRAKLSKIHKGRIITAEQRAKISATKRGVKASAEARKNQSLAQLGKKRSPEFSAKMSALLKGRIFTDKWRAKLSAAAKQPRSEKQMQHTANLGIAAKGKARPVS